MHDLFIKCQFPQRKSSPHTFTVIVNFRPCGSTEMLCPVYARSSLSVVPIGKNAQIKQPVALKNINQK